MGVEGGAGCPYKKVMLLTVGTHTEHTARGRPHLRIVASNDCVGRLDLQSPTDTEIMRSGAMDFNCKLHRLPPLTKVRYQES